LFILPQSWTDAFIPMSIVPKPKQIVRVMVGRLELLSAEREQLALAAVRDLCGPDPFKRERGFQYLRQQGRYVEPIVRRIGETTNDDAVRTLCRRLLLTDFVTELRCAIHNAADGTLLQDDPLAVRAQLGRLLREIGQPEEARLEGVALWTAIRNRRIPVNQMQGDDPATLELKGAAYEAIGDDRRAAAIYARAIHARIASLADHGKKPEQQLALIRDWWVGRAYAQCIGRAGRGDAAIDTLLAELVQLGPRAQPARGGGAGGADGILEE
jgi:hypothetical protein